MTREQVRETVLRVLGSIAPEAAFDALDPNADLREALDIDSVDFLSFAVGLHEALGVDVPEADYAELSTLNGCVAYLAAKCGVR